MAARYGWIITKDLLDGVDAGTAGPSDITPALQAQLDAGEGEEFRMHDDDGELYYEGRLLRTGKLADNDNVLFAPLEDFGLPNAGCTRIYYRQDKPADYPGAADAPSWLPDEAGQGGWAQL